MLEALKDSTSSHYVDRIYSYSDTGGGPVTDNYTIAGGSNRLAGVATGGVASRDFTYDAAGNLITDDDIFMSQTRVLAWNHAGQIASVTSNSVPQGAYTYDYLHRMVARNIQSGIGTVHQVHDIFGNVIAKYHASGYLMTVYVWLEDRPLAVIADAGGTPRTLWVHTDHLQRPILMTDDNGDAVWQFRIAFRQSARLLALVAIATAFGHGNRDGVTCLGGPGNGLHDRDRPAPLSMQINGS